MAALLSWFTGKKTYILVVLAALSIIVRWLAGDLTFIQFLNSDEFLALLGVLGIGTLRAGVTKSGVQ
jgi:hypothetical protein